MISFTRYSRGSGLLFHMNESSSGLQRDKIRHTFGNRDQFNTTATMFWVVTSPSRSGGEISINRSLVHHSDTNQVPDVVFLCEVGCYEALPSGLASGAVA